MSRFSFVLVSFVLGSSVLAAQPVVENLVVQIPEQTVAASTWTTVLDSTRTVNVPTGTAVITWTVAPLGILMARPFIGDARMADSEAPFLMGGLGIGSAAHSWSAPTQAGEITVGLEILQFEENEAAVGGSMSWTLVVYPNDPAVPALGRLGLGALSVALLGAGGLIMHRRKAA